tara:strand:- start:526 stop:654 length:129 start_codon:yes stop_codon:yes gene_type:complete
LQVLDHNLLKDTLRTAPLFRSFSVLTLTLTLTLILPSNLIWP